MRIGVDKNQLSGSHATSNAPKHRQMTKAGASLEPLRLPYGDYILIDDDVQSVLSTKPKPRKKDLIGHIKHFNPRTPCGVRQQTLTKFYMNYQQCLQK